MTYFAVITKIPDEPDGNYATEPLLISPSRRDKHLVGSGLYVSPPMNDAIHDLMGAALCGEAPTDRISDRIVFCSVPVFELGEILIMDGNDRTIPDGRKPDKWEVEYETFNDLDEAIKRAKEVCR